VTVYGRGRGIEDSGVRGPGIVFADGPVVALGVCAGEGFAAIVHSAEIEDHLGAGCFGRCVDGIAIADEEIDAARLAAADTELPSRMSRISG